ncbi:MAG: fluoride efflux transporter CrcB [Chloroflexia bacterium]|nr:fluoride efflux transporter CrcB [Chloroflexia bacterium]
MADIVWISVGAVAGANARFALGRLIEGQAGSRIPYGTLCVNITGSLLIGIVLVLLTERLLADPHWRLLLVVGFLGSYTTMSSYAWETLTLAEAGSWGHAMLYVIGTNALCLGACGVGMVVARAIR